tara:strand:- start:311 stop:847 length:537 start_codon:yes stop_codon:yes gene_type:complete
MKKKIVYLITNKINGKGYVGMTTMGDSRWKDHIRQSRKDVPLQLVDIKIKEYGIDNFDYEILEECKSWEELQKREIHWIDKLDTFVGNNGGYNKTLGGGGAHGFKMPVGKIQRYWLGKKHSKKSNEKRSVAMKKYRANSVNPFTTERVRKKLSDVAKTRTGQKNGNYKHGNWVGVNKK